MEGAGGISEWDGIEMGLRGIRGSWRFKVKYESQIERSNLNSANIISNDGTNQIK